MKKIRMLVIIASVFFGLPPCLRSSGFLIYEHGAAAMGMAGAYVSIANDPSAVFHNPAGMIWLGGTQLSFGGTFIVPKGSLSLPNWQNPAYNNIHQEDQTFLVPNFYLTHSFSSKIAAGIGVFAPYGLGTKWPRAYPLRYIGTSTDMETIFINPAVSFMINDNLAVGAGMSYVHSSLSLDLVKAEVLNSRIIDIPASADGATGNAMSFNVGALYKTSDFALGLTWRSSFNMKYKGTVVLDASNVPAPFKSFIPRQGDIETTFRFPDILTAGVSFNLTEALLLSVDVQYFTWKRYNKYIVTITYPVGFSPAEPETVIENWKNTFIFRAGLQYQLNEKLTLRAGLLFDQTPQPEESVDPNLPDANRLALTAGFGYKIGRLVISAAYQFENFAKRESPNRNIYPQGFGEGTYKTTGHLFGISLGYNF